MPRRASNAAANARNRLGQGRRSEEHTSELQSRRNLVCRLLLEDTIAINLGAHGVCSGDATVNVYRFINLEGVSAETIGLALTDFAHFAAALPARPGIGLPGARRDDDHEISELNILD